MPLTTVNQGLLSTDAQYTGFKNRLINGAMMIDQRNAGGSVTPASGTTTYTVDRFGFYVSQSSKMTAQQSSVAPTGFKNSLLVTSSSAYSVVSSDIFLLQQAIEGLNVADLGWGTANASPVTLSFWVRSSLTGTFGGSIVNSSQNRSYPFSYTISAANTYEYKTITIAGDTSGTWLTTNGVGMFVFFGIGVGSTYTGTANAWAGSTLYAPTGATSVVGTNGATFYITGVQLEKGSTATSFDYRPYGTELALCQRYYNKVVGAPSSLALFMRQNAVGGGNSTSLIYPFKVTMRAVPTWIRLGTWIVFQCQQPIANMTSPEYVTITADATTAGDSYTYANSTSIGFEVSAEL